MAGRLKREGRPLGHRKTHGMTDSPEYGVWRAMRNRCYRKKDISYPDYGGRGIRVCDRWRHSFAAFFADMGLRPATDASGRYTIERRDVNGIYEKDNCYWATYKEQRNNTRTNRYITINGETKTMTQWCEMTGVPLNAASARIHRMGWDEALAVTQPVHRR